jgi:hypothetical protein
MTAIFDRILENALGCKMEQMIPRGDIQALIAGRVRKELSGEQTQDVIETLTHDMSIITNLM